MNMSDQKRTKGFLTDTDRAFLRGEKEYKSKQGRYDRRRAIRERTRAAFHDFAFLEGEIDDDERNKIFDPPREEVLDLSKALYKTISFLYRSLEGDVADPDLGDRSFQFRFNDILEVGIRHGEMDRHPQPFRGRIDYDPPVVEVHRKPEPSDVEHAIDELAKHGGRGLSDEELRSLIVTAASETISDNEFTTTIGGEPVEEALDIEKFDLHGIAERVEQRAEELAAEDDVDEE